MRIPRALQRFLSPARALALGFAAVLLTGTASLLLPVSYRADAPTVVDALFTAVSAVCLTGLIVVDTATAWTGTGQAVILVLIQLGGLGVMSIATILAKLTMRRLGMRARATAADEKRVTPGEALQAVRGIVTISLVVEGVTAAILFLRLLLGHGYPAGRALAHAVFHAVSAFNNAGFALHTDNLVGFDDDPLILLPIAAAVVLGGLGFPVIMEVLRGAGRPRHWSLTSKLVLSTTPVLLAGGALTTFVLERRPGRVLADMPLPQAWLGAVFHSVVSRTAGFNAVDVGAMAPETWLVTDVLMTIGGGPAGTAGGLKITTVVVLLAMARAELRGDPYVPLFGKRLSRAVHREAATLVMLMAASLLLATLALMLLDGQPLDRALFEVTSAASTTGLSTGITAALSDPSKLILCLLMFAGRVGPVTLLTAIALKRRPLQYEAPKERPILA